jgi:general secretion pathway protein N
MRALPWLKLEDLSATRDRPLFAQSRRPPPPPVAAIPTVSAPQKEEEAPDARPNLSLRGIIRQDASTLVVLEDNSTSESIVVRSGDSYGRWRVTAESDDSVKLADESEELRLNLFRP